MAELRALAAKKKKRRAAKCTPAKKKRSKKGAKKSEVNAFDARRKHRACVKKKAKKKPKHKAVAPKPVQPVPPAPRPPATTPAAPALPSPIAKYTGPFGVRQAERLLWRAGFGPSPGHAEALVALGFDNAVLALTRPQGEAVLTGAAPTVDGDPLAPADAWGHDHLWWLDRMVRSNQPLIERMTLVWHDWFACSAEVAGQQKMLDQNGLFRRAGLGSFRDLALAVTSDPAMILYLNLNENTKKSPNENYARELQELFTLGADRDAYTEDDVRELARALTGWRNDYSAEEGEHNFRFDPNRHDATAKTVFGQTGNYDWQDAVSLCVNNPKHASFFVAKLWSYFIPTAPSPTDSAALEKLYVNGGFQIRPVLEAILAHPALYTGPRMVKPPAVFLAGMLRQQQLAIDTGAWVWLSDDMGQHLFRPPNVAGWDDNKWLDTSTLRARWITVAYALEGRALGDAELQAYDDTETPEAAVAAARAFWSDPPLTGEGVAALGTFATTCLPAGLGNWQKHYYRGIRQNALRQLIATSPDLQTS
jgi:hypothetical protein